MGLRIEKPIRSLDCREIVTLPGVHGVSTDNVMVIDVAVLVRSESAGAAAAPGCGGKVRGALIGSGLEGDLHW